VDKANAAGGVGGNKIQILFEDDQPKPDQSILGFNRLADRRDVPMIFTACPAPSPEIARLATQKQIVLVNAGAQADTLATGSPYLVNTLPAIGDEVQAMSRYLIGEGKRRGAILFENDAAGVAGRDDFGKYIPEAGGSILAQEPIQSGQTDFRAALLKVAYARPEVMLVSIRAGLLQMARQYKRLGLNFTIAGTTFLGDPDILTDPSLEGFVHTQVRIDAPPELAAEFKAKFGLEMKFAARQYYNATQVGLAVADKVLADGKKLTGANMLDALLAIRKFQGLVPLEFKGHTATVPLDINVVRGGKDVTVKRND
jgi:branched-chain amino acid transport system substrate-binding protein